jgi:hypothetical protein
MRGGVLRSTLAVAAAVSAAAAGLPNLPQGLAINATFTGGVATGIEATAANVRVRQSSDAAHCAPPGSPFRQVAVPARRSA